jgi:pimeloyl-ACP methyl ester carboxylesterase
VHCGDTGAVSPCDDGKTGAAHLRGCPTVASDSFDEYQGTVSLPVFQQGTPPYAQPADGGGIFLDASGKVSIVRSGPVCFSLTVPKGTAPTAGWPLVVYSHGTGGSYRSAIDLGLAADYAGGAATGGAAVPMATLGYDGVLHGTRNGGSTDTPDNLVYNFYNPRAARDNNLQAAADLLALPRAFSGQVTTAIKIDGGHVALYGHSQGGNAAALAAARDAGYGAAVMSGTGGTIMLSLLGKTQPINLPLLLPIMLHDSPVDQNHPVLNLLQMYFERSDPVNFARRLFREPLLGAQRRHVLHVYGTLDTYAPNETQRRYAQAAAFQVALPLVDSYPNLAEYDMTTVASPIVANQSFGALSPITAAQVQYAPNGYDGHFVSTLNPAARTAIQEMLVTLTRETNPIIEP